MTQDNNGGDSKVVNYIEFLSEMGVESVPKRKIAEGRSTASRVAAPKPTAGISPTLMETKPIGKSRLSAVVNPFSENPPDKPATMTADTDLDSIRADIGDCRRCKLHLQRTNIVFSSGNPKARVMFVGEGPGADEDLQGLPFVGKAGQMLTKIIEAVSFTRDEVYIANVVKCRPPENRTPEKDEIAACRGFLFRQIACIQPRLICALGAPSAQTLLGCTSAIGL
jgi:uracil-DNA glycosylase family 4